VHRGTGATRRTSGRALRSATRRVSSVQWATACPAECSHRPCCPVTTTNDQLAPALSHHHVDPRCAPVLGALSEGADLFERTVNVLAPARPRGYAVKDLKEIALRNDALVVLGRGPTNWSTVFAPRRSVTSAGGDLNVARSLNTSPDPELLSSSCWEANEPRDESVISTPTAALVESGSVED